MGLPKFGGACVARYRYCKHALRYLAIGTVGAQPYPPHALRAVHEIRSRGS